MKTLKWHKIADSKSELNFGGNNLLQLDVAGKAICIAKVIDKMFACTHKCPHAGGMIADGIIDPLGNLVCPLHHYKFSLQNGRNISGEGYYLKTFPIQETEDGVFVGLDENATIA